jgi:hypothetical protein
MKPDWDKLADEAHPSVFIADVNCSDEADLVKKTVFKDTQPSKFTRMGKRPHITEAEALRTCLDL